MNRSKLDAGAVLHLGRKTSTPPVCVYLVLAFLRLTRLPQRRAGADYGGRPPAMGERNEAELAGLRG